MTYQRISLATTDPVGDPGPLPFAVANWKPEQVLDLSELNSAYGLTDAGFWPIVDDIPDYDPATETVVAGDLTKDGPGKRFVREWTVEALPVPPPVPSLVASGVFSVTDGWLEGVGAAAGIGMAFALDVGTYWIMFSDPQPDLGYAAPASSSQGQINVQRNLEYVEVTVRDGSGSLIDPSEFSITIMRAM